MKTRDRVRAVLALTALPLAVGTLGAAGAAQGGGPVVTPAAPFPGETFVAETSEPGLFVAVVLAEATAGAAEREARAYLCNGMGAVDEWLTGTVAGGALALRSDDGAIVDGDLGADAVRGTATLPDGTAVGFAAEPVAGIAGLYTVVAGADRRLVGASAAGGVLEGLVAPEPGTEPAEHAGHYLVVGIATPPDDQPVAFSVYRTTTEAGQFRWIALADGRVTGVGKTASGVIDPSCEP